MCYSGEILLIKMWKCVDNGCPLNRVQTCFKWKNEFDSQVISKTGENLFSLKILASKDVI